MILAVVHNDDAPLVSASLTKSGYFVTKMASTGGFLMSGNTTFLLGVEDNAVDSVISIISKYSKKRMQTLERDAFTSGNFNVESSSPMQVQLGGATVFVLNVERFERV